MDGGVHSTGSETFALSDLPKSFRLAVLAGGAVVCSSALAAILLPQGFLLAAFGDTLQVSLVATAAILAFRNFLSSHCGTRSFWLLVSLACFLWTISNGIWAVYELCLGRPVPDVAAIDVLLFVKVVPLTAALLIAPKGQADVSSRTFGFVDVVILMLFSLYLFTFNVFAYRLLPGAQATYDFHFDLADAIGNQILLVAAGIALLSSLGSWRIISGLYFFCAVCYGLGSNLSNFAIDRGAYYTGSLYDVPLVASSVGFVLLALFGSSVESWRLVPAQARRQENGPASSFAFSFLLEHAAMSVAVSTPLIGMWLLSGNTSPALLRPFRLIVTLLAIFLLTVLLSIKEDLLATGLFQLLQGLSETRSSIERFQTHLTQSEKLASLGELVAQAAKQIKGCMALILESSLRLTFRPDVDSRIQNMAGKIGQYAQRTDVLVENMLRFARETPLQFAPTDVKPVLDSALHLSRIAKRPNVRLVVDQERDCPLVCADSSQLLHVFLQLISNAIDALDETGGGSFEVSIRSLDSRVFLEFADSGGGLKEPQRVFEPFYTTKPVGKGTGLGLSTCYGIIQQHQGEISCRNRPEGGAVFTIVLPCVAQSGPDQALDGTLVAEGVR